MDGLALFVVLSGFLFLAGFAIGYRRRGFYTFQNEGEARLSRALKERFGAPDHHLLNHVTLRTADGTTQIDHVLVSRFGVFVIENKRYSGWIVAGSRDRQWTQVLYRARFHFQNPVHQNYGHVCAIRELLDVLPPDVEVPVVVFTGSARFKTPVPVGVFQVADFLSYLAQQVTPVLSIDQMQFCIGRLEMERLALTRRTDVEHIQLVRRRYGVDD